MKFTLSWLKDHLETDAPLEDIIERLTMIGLEVESFDDRSALRPFVVARVVTADKHPDADRLKVLTVDTGTGDPVQVVCGAPNARAGLVGAFAGPGSLIPGTGTVLAIGRIRGVESHGMMCSERELELSDDHEGIIDLPDDAPVGTPFAAYAGLDDPIIEINLTPNRPDCTGVRGIARDLAASGLGRLKEMVIEPVDGRGACPVKLQLDFPQPPSLCRGFALRQVSHVVNRPSPGWLQRRLRAVGLRPINALVDVTNYITFDCGRPLHVFDASKVAGDLTVRRAREGESILALDGREYALGPDMCVIADNNGVESIAGIMGGESSGCDFDTTHVLIESALWEPLNIARTGRTLGVTSDARYRFERGVDPAFMIPGLERATRMILELCGGEPSDYELVGFAGPPDRHIAFPVSEVARLTGLDLDPGTIRSILERLGFAVRDQEGTEKGTVLDVVVPSWRPDVEGKADLVEEVMRIHGVEEIGPRPLPARSAVNTRILTSLQIRTRSAKRILATRGMMEAVTWSFIPTRHAELFGGGRPELRLANPIAEVLSDMRPSLLPGLIAAAQRNADRGFADVALFEVSGTYEDTTPSGQRSVAAGLRRGSARMDGQGRHWSGNAPAVDLFEAKADALAVLETCGAPVDKLQVVAEAPSWYHPGRSGSLRLGPRTLATFGEFHPRVLKEIDVTGPLCGFEVYLDAMAEPKARATRTRPRLDLSPFQVVRRDFAFVVNREIEAGALMRAAAGADRKLITGVSVFDVFEGAALGADKKSVALEVSIQPADRTLTDDDFEALAERIVDHVNRHTGGVLRT